MSRSQQRPNNLARALRAFKFWMNSCQAFCPRSAKKFGENRFCLVVERVRVAIASRYFREDEELPEPRVTKRRAASSMLSAGLPISATRSAVAGLGRFARLGQCRTFDRPALRGRVHARLVKGQAQLRGKRAAEFQVAVGLRSA